MTKNYGLQTGVGNGKLNLHLNSLIIIKRKDLLPRNMPHMIHHITEILHTKRSRKQNFIRPHGMYKIGTKQDGTHTRHMTRLAIGGKRRMKLAFRKTLFNILPFLMILTISRKLHGSSVSSATSRS